MSRHASGRLEIKLFGEFHVQRDGHSLVALLPGRQGRALLAYLVLNRPRAVEREELLDVLWAAGPPASPDAALSSVLAKVRRAVGADLISGRGALTLRLSGDDEVDVQRVVAQTEQSERALVAGDAAAALELARWALALLAQPLLPGLQGEWVEGWRRRFRELRPRALTAAARAGLALGGDNLPAAERAACALVEIEPFRESAHALLMQTQARRGDVPEAIRTFDRFRTLLREELGTYPSREFVELHERLLHDGDPRAVDGDPPVEDAGRLGLPAPDAGRLGDGAFVGRGGCLDRLREIWQDGRQQQAQLALIVGEPGVGKTRLAAQFAQEVHGDGGVVLYGRADEDALLPHQPFVEALRPLLTQEALPLSPNQREILGRLIPDLPAPAGDAVGDEATLRYRLFEAVLAALSCATRRSPVLLVLDDLHWADKATLLLLRHLLRSSELRDMLVVGTLRDVRSGPDECLNDVLADIRRDRCFERIKIDGFQVVETAEFISDRLGLDVTPGFVHRLCEQTEGNAFFIEEILLSLKDAELPPCDALTESTLSRIGVPDGVADVIARRLRRLSAVAAAALTAAAVSGRTFRLDVIGSLFEADPEELIAALEEGIAAGLIREIAGDVDVFAFSHDIVREVLYGQLATSRRVRMHHRVGEALERLAQREAINPAELAHHFRIARHLAGDDRARDYSRTAGDRATMLLAYEEAVQHFQLAVELYDDDEDGERCAVLLALGRVQWHAGDERARETFVAAAESASRRGDQGQLARAALGLGERWFETPFVDDRYHELFEQAVRSTPARDTPLRALLLSRMAQHIGFPNESERAMGMSEEALAMARRVGDRNALTSALLARHVTLTDTRHLPRRLALMNELATAGGDHRELTAEHHHWRLYDLFELGDLETAEREHAQLEALAAELRQPLLLSITVGWRGIRAALTGDVEHAAFCAEEGLRHARSAHMQDAVSTWAAKLFSARRHDDRVTGIIPIVERLAAGAGRHSGWQSALATLHLEAGDETAARAIYERELERGTEAVPRGMYWLTRVVLLSELCAKLGDGDRAEALYAALAPYAHRNVIVAYSAFWGPVDSYLAYLADTMGDHRLASGHLRSALARTRSMGASLLTAEIEQRYREVLAA